MLKTNFFRTYEERVPTYGFVGFNDQTDRLDARNKIGTENEWCVSFVRFQKVQTGRNLAIAKTNLK